MCVDLLLQVVEVLILFNVYLGWPNKYLSSTSENIHGEFDLHGAECILISITIGQSERIFLWVRKFYVYMFN